MPNLLGMFWPVVAANISESQVTVAYPELGRRGGEKRGDCIGQLPGDACQKREVSRPVSKVRAQAFDRIANKIVNVQMRPSKRNGAGVRGFVDRGHEVAEFPAAFLLNFGLALWPRRTARRSGSFRSVDLMYECTCFGADGR